MELGSVLALQWRPFHGTLSTAHGIAQDGPSQPSEKDFANENPSAYEADAGPSALRLVRVPSPGVKEDDGGRD